jgi:hypothetical protein
LKTKNKILKKTILKSWIVILIVLLNKNINMAQEFHGIDTPPVYNGGKKALREFIDKNLILPDGLTQAGISGTVTLKLLIDQDGKVENIKLMRGINESCDSAVIRVASLLEDWQAATRNGKPISLYILLPVELTCKKNIDDGKTFIVNGMVTEKCSEKPIEGAIVVLDGTNIGTITDRDGRYSLEIPGENMAFEISSLGYMTRKEEIGKNHTINIELESEYYVINLN